jgi:hypothetical protein
MADGNFNRSPLSTNNYQSGVRAGKAAMRTIALTAIEHSLQKHLPELPVAKRETILQSIKEIMNQ